MRDKKIVIKGNSEEELADFVFKNLIKIAKEIGGENFRIKRSNAKKVYDKIRCVIHKQNSIE